MAEKCEICGSENISRNQIQGENATFMLQCEKCGRYRVSLGFMLYDEKHKDQHVEAKLRHWLSQNQKEFDNGSYHAPLLDEVTIERILEKPLPGPKELADNVVRFLATKSVLPGDEISVEIENKFQLGAGTTSALQFACNHARDSKWVSEIEPFSSSGFGSTNSGIHTSYESGPILSLTMKGWEYYEELKRGHADSRKAFMAMQFGDEQLNRVFKNVLKPAMKAVGFDLFNLADRERLKAGLIDDRMRVEIQSSAIVLADLTHQNAGAYWEAGYAEGLGKPVIYTCKKEVFDREKTHFDTNHHLTIIWEPENLEEAVEDLKATVRATLPDLAVVR